MKLLAYAILLAVLLACSLSCSRHETLTLSNTCGSRVLVAQDKDLMERVVECGLSGKCDSLCTMELFPSGKVFSVAAGTKVLASIGFSLSKVRKIRVLEGEFSGREGWVYELVLYQARSNAPFQQTVTRRHTDRRGRSAGQRRGPRVVSCQSVFPRTLCDRYL